MSAIFGIHYLDSRPIEPQLLARMQEILAHRGQDGTGIWHRDSIGLGHRLLWTTPESLSEQQPLTDNNGNFILTADARIDNRDELIASLNLTSSNPKDITDSQLILLAYEKWGETSPEKLLGDFAFAIWDKPRQKLFCARDHSGVKPFFYYYQPEKIFIFATEIKAILCHSEVPRSFNQLKVARYFTVKLVNDNTTFYENILRLPAGHSLTLTSSGMAIRRYWSLDPSREIKLGSNAEYAEAFREIFTEAVKCRLRSAFPIGSKLSGGLDSSFVSAIARDIMTSQNREPLHTFSARFHNISESDERYFQDLIIAQGNLQPHFVEPENISPFINLEKFLWHHDEPFLSANEYLLWIISELANKLKIRVLLNGFDGDNTVSHGLDHYRELARRGQWLNFAKETWEYGKTKKIPRKKVLKAQYELLAQNAIKPRILSFSKNFSPIDVVEIYRSKKQASAANNSNFYPPLNPEFVRRINFKDRLQVDRLPPRKTERDRHHQLLTNGIIQHFLESTGSRDGAFGIENRFPFCDKRLLEFCLALPPEQKLHYGWDRIVMRRAMEGILPAEVQWRQDKANFAFSLAQGLYKYEKERFRYIVRDKAHLIENFVDLSLIQESYDRFVANNATDTDINALHKTVVLGSWLEKTQLV